MAGNEAGNRKDIRKMTQDTLKHSSIGRKGEIRMTVRVYDMGFNPPRYFDAHCADDCADATDRSAYLSACELGDVITMGEVVACPIWLTPRNEVHAVPAGEPDS